MPQRKKTTRKRVRKTIIRQDGMKRRTYYKYNRKDSKTGPYKHRVKTKRSNPKSKRKITKRRSAVRRY